MTVLRTAPIAVLVLALLAAVPLASSAASSGNTSTGTARKKSTKVKIAKSDSAESPADRAKRMARECRGLPNSGACQGYGYGS